MRVARVDWHSPVVVLALQLDAELHPLRRDEAETDVVDLQITSQRGKMHVRHRLARQVLPIESPVGEDLLDMHRRRDFVEGKMTGIDDSNAFSRQEPKSAICGLRDGRIVGGSRNCAEPHTIRRIPEGGLDPALRVGDPPVQFRPGDTHEAAGRVQPQRTIVVFHRPVNRVTGQTVPGRERGDAAILDPAEAALLCRGPQRTIAIKLKGGNRALAQPNRGCV